MRDQWVHSICDQPSDHLLDWEKRCCCLKGKVILQDLEPDHNTDMNLMSYSLHVVFAIPKAPTPINNNIVWVTTVPRLFYSQKLIFFTQQSKLTDTAGILYFSTMEQFLKERPEWNWLDQKDLLCHINCMCKPCVPRLYGLVCCHFLFGKPSVMVRLIRTWLEWRTCVYKKVIALQSGGVEGGVLRGGPDFSGVLLPDRRAN